VSALLLHHYRRVVVRRAVNYDFAGALPPSPPERAPVGSLRRHRKWRLHHHLTRPLTSGCHWPAMRTASWSRWQLSWGTSLRWRS